MSCVTACSRRTPFPETGRSAVRKQVERPRFSQARPQRGGSRPWARWIVTAVRWIVTAVRWIVTAVRWIATAVRGIATAARWIVSVARWVVTAAQRRLIVVRALLTAARRRLTKAWLLFRHVAEAFDRGAAALRSFEVADGWKGLRSRRCSHEAAIPGSWLPSATVILSA